MKTIEMPKSIEREIERKNTIEFGISLAFRSILALLLEKKGADI